MATMDRAAFVQLPRQLIFSATEPPGREEKSKSFEMFKFHFIKTKTKKIVTFHNTRKNVNYHLHS